MDKTEKGRRNEVLDTIQYFNFKTVYLTQLRFSAK